MAWTRVNQAVNAGNKVGATSLVTGVLANAAAVGDVLFAFISFDNVATVDGTSNDCTSVTDTKGNTWTKIGERSETNGGAAADGIASALYMCNVTVALTVTDTITVNFSASVLAKQIAVEKFTIAAGKIAVQVGATTTGGAQATVTGPSKVISGLTSAAYLWVALDAFENTALTYNQDADYTTTGTRQTTGSTATTNIQQAAGYRSFTGTTDTHAATVTTTAVEWAGIYAAFQEIFPPERLDATATATPSTSAEAFEATETAGLTGTATLSLTLQDFWATETINASATATLTLSGEVYVPASGSPYIEALALTGLATLTFSSEVFWIVETLVAASTAPPSFAAETFLAVETLGLTATATPIISAFVAIFVDTPLGLTATATPSFVSELRIDAETLNATATATPAISAFVAIFVDTPLGLTATAAPTLSSEQRIDVETLNATGTATPTLSKELRDDVERVALTATVTPTFASEVNIGAIVETLNVTATLAGKLSAQKRISWITGAQASIEGAEIANSTKYVNAYHIPEASILSSMECLIDGLGSGVGNQTLRYIIYSDSAGSAGALLASSGDLGITDNSPQSYRNIQFSATFANAIYHFGIHGSTITKSAQMYQENSVPQFDREVNSDTYSDGASNPYGAITILHRRLVLKVYYEVDESSIYLDGSPPTLLETVSSGAANNPPLTATASAGGTVFEVGITAERADVTATASLSLPTEGNVYVETRVAAATATPVLSEIFTGSGGFPETLTLNISALPSKALERTVRRYGDLTPGNDNILSTDAGNCYLSKVTVDESSNVVRAWVYADALGPGTGTAAMKMALYTDVGDTSGAPTILPPLPDMSTWTVITDPNPNVVFKFGANGVPAAQDGVNYIIQFPVERTRGIQIIGGGNVYIPELRIKCLVRDSEIIKYGGGAVGRWLRVDNYHIDPNGQQCDFVQTSIPCSGRDLYFKTGILEKLIGSTDATSDPGGPPAGTAPGGVDWVGVHADAIQSSGGIGDVLIEDSEWKSTYQGLQLQQEAKLVGSAKAVQSLARVGVTVTVQSTGHGLVAGKYIVLSGTNQSGFHGAHKIKTATTNAYTYDLAITPAATTATGGSATEMQYGYTVGSVKTNRHHHQGFVNTSNDPAEALAFGRIGARCAPPHINEDRTLITDESWNGTADWGEETYVTPVSGDVGGFVEPDKSTANWIVVRPVQHNEVTPNYASWDNWPKVSGKVKQGPPPGGPFVVLQGGIPVATTQQGTSSVPGTLVAVSDEVIVPRGQAAGWVEAVFSLPQGIQPGDYWLGPHVGPTTSILRLYRSIATDGTRFEGDNYSNGTNPTFIVAPANRADYRLSVRLETEIVQGSLATFVELLTANAAATVALTSEVVTLPFSSAEALSATGTVTPSFAAEVVTAASNFIETLALAGAATGSLPSQLLDGSDVLENTITATPSLAKESGDQAETVKLTATAAASKLSFENLIALETLVVFGTFAPELPVEDEGAAPAPPDFSLTVECYTVGDVVALTVNDETVEIAFLDELVEI